uniref:BPTI/Kunitz inhibitor domain-containing protein n=1 Tax=Plectus sambesii TaxID=2011161 RepID=A0A914UV44_9BILA
MSTAICNAPLAVGSCSNFVTRYYYDTASGQCRTFQYSGCGGNSNNFNSLSICQSTCGGVGVTGSSQCPADANVGLNCQFVRPNACNTDADCIGRVNTIQPTCCVTTCGYKICYQNY